jgi:hypothetical protein
MGGRRARSLTMEQSQRPPHSSQALPLRPGRITDRRRPKNPSASNRRRGGMGSRETAAGRPGNGIVAVGAAEALGASGGDRRFRSNRRCQSRGFASNCQSFWRTSLAPARTPAPPAARRRAAAVRQGRRQRMHWMLPRMMAPGTASAAQRKWRRGTLVVQGRASELGPPGRSSGLEPPGRPSRGTPAPAAPVRTGRPAQRNASAIRQIWNRYWAGTSGRRLRKRRPGWPTRG